MTVRKKNRKYLPRAEWKKPQVLPFKVLRPIVEVVPKVGGVWLRLECGHWESRGRRWDERRKRKTAECDECMLKLAPLYGVEVIYE